MSCLKPSENSEKKSNGPSEPLLKYDDMPSLQNVTKKKNLMLTISNLRQLGIVIGKNQDWRPIWWNRTFEEDWFGHVQ